jgi:hypothetical protein
MLNSIPPYFFWSAWRYFLMWERLFLLSLSVLVIYTLYCAFNTGLRVRRDSADVAHVFAALQRRSMRVQRLIGTAFYLFGIVLFWSLQWAYMTVDNSRTPVGWLILENFATHFVFAFNVFIAFLILHMLGWFLGNQIDTFRLRHKLEGLTSLEDRA